MRSTKSLTAQQLEIVKNFSGLGRNDYVHVDKNATYADVLNSVLQQKKDAPKLNELLSNSGDSESYVFKYQDKLLQAAKSKGYNSVEELLEEKKRADELKRKEDSKMKNENTKASKTIEESTSTTIGKTYSKNLDDIMKIDKIMEQTPEKIAEMWNIYHSTRNAISASIDGAFYEELYLKSKKFPMFVLPLARNDGYEIYLLQFQGHQVYFTPLMEYQLKKESARPYFSVSFYTEIMREKGIVLMLGELADENGSLELKEAQHLIYQLQLFYMTGNQKQKEFVHKFWNSPQDFSYEDQIASLSELSS